MSNVSYALYRPEQERGACGTGFVADIAGQPSQRVLAMALTGVTNLSRRSAPDAASPATGDAPDRRKEETCQLARG